MRDDSGHETRGLHNLPARLTSFVGREREIAEIRALLKTQRLVTLVGAPGVGKTRLGLQIATGLLDRFPDGVWLVELAPLADPALVPQAVAGVLGVREQPGRTLTATLAGYLRQRRLLLVLDNCEHLVGAVAALAESLLQACTSLHVLATSREPLTIEGEVLRRVPSLTVPDVERLGSPGVASTAPLAESEAVRLFVERARVTSPSFALTESNAPIVAQVCARLDGIPLAIELAAARVRALSLEQIAARLDDRFRLLTGGSRTALPRQQTLRGAVDWSYDLLSEPEQALLRRLAVFAGGFTLDAAECVGGGQSGAGSGDSSAGLVDLLTALVDKSMVQVEEDGDGEPRYRLLETLRQYSQEKLIEHGEQASARDRHRDYFLALAEEVAPALNERADSTLLTRLEREHDNLRAALVWCLDEPSDDPGGPTQGQDDQTPTGAALGVRIAAAIWRFWWLRGHIGEGRRWLARALAASPTDGSPAGLSARALALLGIANLSIYQSDYRAAVSYMTENLAFCRETGNDRGVVTALHRLGYYLAHLGESERPSQLCEESVALGRRLGHPATLAGALHTSGRVARMLGRPDQSVYFLEEAIGLLREIGNFTVMAYALRAQSHALADLGDLAGGLALAEEGLRMSREVGDMRGMAESFKDIARAALFADDADRAIEPLRNALALLPQGDRWLTSICLDILAGVLMVWGTPTQSNDVAGPVRNDGLSEHLLDAARLYGWADLLREQIGLDPPPEMRGIPQRHVVQLRERLGEATFSQVWAEGRAMSFEDVTEYALALTAPAEPGASRPAPGLPLRAGTPDLSLAGDPEVVRLTAREREVAVLVAQGLTNRRIAEALVLSERTADSHVRNIMSKLAVGSRAQIAAWAVQHGLGDDR
jgi:predicted ATPase/DNA-binding CsgD family transcriptional regulator